MSLLDADIDMFKINLYYKFVEISSGKKLIILEDKEAERQIEDKKEGVVIEKLVTNWRILNWKEQNDVISSSYKGLNQNIIDKQFDFIVYRDAIIKRCLKSWDMVIDENPVPLTPDTIDRLPGPVVLALYEKFEKVIDYSEEEVKN